MKLINRRKTLGQSIVEYVLLTALVALAAVAMFRTFRNDVRTAYEKAGQALIQGVDQSITTQPSTGE